jgi:hypothetical protein
MKTLSSPRISERERRYPVCVAFDTTINWLLCSALFVCAALLVGFIVMKNSPEFVSQVMQILWKIRG